VAGGAVQVGAVVVAVVVTTQLVLGLVDQAAVVVIAVTTDGAGAGAHARGVGVVLRVAAGGGVTDRAGGGVADVVAALGGEAVVLVQGLLLIGAERAVGVDPGGTLDLVLVVADLDVGAAEARVLQRDEGLRRAEEAGLDGDPARCAGGVVDVDLADATDLVAVQVDDVAVGGVEAL
jgi:hypothetical protein